MEERIHPLIIETYGTDVGQFQLRVKPVGPSLRIIHGDQAKFVDPDLSVDHRQRNALVLGVLYANGQICHLSERGIATHAVCRPRRPTFDRHRNRWRSNGIPCKFDRRDIGELNRHIIL